ncbi:MAG: cyclic nucleotide-binding domain-containing protein [Deltaproteobacteria bacterium]|nr:cyclic nucleotide-binding domain-containing protein [Deltaproteobacteria bacterium]
MLDVHRPYPGVILLVSTNGSVLFGAPADAFKATKACCQRYKLPFPRVLVAPQRMLVDFTPQFAPEFFLYDFLFVHGAAFKPDLQNERLTLVLDADRIENELRALSLTLNGPSRDELTNYRDAEGKTILDAKTVSLLADISEHLAIKKDHRPRRLEEMVSAIAFDQNGSVDLLDSTLQVIRTGPANFLVRSSNSEVEINLDFETPITPFSTLPVPIEDQTPASFALKSLGTRSGFDLTGPTTGFLLWLNGHAVLYDGPVGTRYLLERQGINPNDISAVVLSHCHEDHMGSFIDLILGGHKPKLFTAEPIYRSMLQKLSHQLRLTDKEVASFIDYTRITPGTPLDAFGATFNFFYTIHSIPTIGMSVTMRGPSDIHRIQISGDTMSHHGLDELKAAGVIDSDTHLRMRNLIPARVNKGAIYLADVGEAIIHGNPQDWEGNPNRILYYHCPDDDHTREFGHEVAKPGVTNTLIEAPRFHPAVPGRLLQALSFMNFTDPGWLTTFLHRGRIRRAAANEVLVRSGTNSGNLSIIISGAAEVRNAEGTILTELRPSELFGAIELVDNQHHYSAEVRSITPTEVFEIDGTLITEYVEANNLQETLTRTWQNRPNIDSARLFRTIDAPIKSRIAALGTEEKYVAGGVIYTQGAIAEDFFLLTEGRVALDVDGQIVREINAADENNFFGEIAAIVPHRRRSSTVKTLTPVSTLRLPGKELRRLVVDEMAFRYTIVMTIKKNVG